MTFFRYNEIDFRCCKIDDFRHTEKRFESFQKNFPLTCGHIDFETAQSCEPSIRNQRTLMIFLYSLMAILRLTSLYLLWKYINDEYNNDLDTDLVSVESNDDDARTSTTTSVA